MAMVTLEYDARNSTMKKALDLFVSLGAKVVATPSKKTVGSRKLTEVEISMQEAREGKINHYESVEDMFQKNGIPIGGFK